jgi:hypothetical protein
MGRRGEAKILSQQLDFNRALSKGFAHQPKPGRRGGNNRRPGAAAGATVDGTEGGGVLLRLRPLRASLVEESSLLSDSSKVPQACEAALMMHEYVRGPVALLADGNLRS